MIKINDVTHIFEPGTINEVVAVKNFSFTINDGDFITVIGSNGAGKSTLLNLISGTFIPTHGKIWIQDRNVTKMPEYKRAQFIGRIHQNPLMGTAGNMSIEQNMALCRKKGFRGLSFSLNKNIRQQFAKELKMLNMGLEERMKDSVGLLSGGQRQALTLLTTVLSRPDMLLLDEHTAALDPGNADAVMALTDKFIKDCKMTAMMVTHNMSQAIKYGNRLLMMDKGCVILDIKGEEKAKLTVDKLITKFKELRTSLVDTDAVMLEDIA